MSSASGLYVDPPRRDDTSGNKDNTKDLPRLLKVIRMSDRVSTSGMRFSFILPGAFVMGSVSGEENEQPPHQVVIGRPFYMGTYVVTQRDWRELMGTEPWKGDPHVREGDRYPAVNVSWYDVQGYLGLMSERDPGNSYSLPTEAEWEYAARAGTDTQFSFGDDERDLRFFGWYRDITQGREEYVHEVGKKRPNPWGLYDMHGNVKEWTDDWYYGSYSAQPRLDPLGKVIRGGAWDYPAYGARSAFRSHVLPRRSGNFIGFRVIRRPVGRDQRYQAMPSRQNP